MTELTTMPQAELLVCVLCRKGQPAEDLRPGAALHDALLARDLPAGLKLTPVDCLSNCSNGCTIALRGKGRWTYIYGNLDAADNLDAILDGATRYKDSENGLVPWRDRPEHFRKNCIARIPPMEA